MTTDSKAVCGGGEAEAREEGGRVTILPTALWRALDAEAEIWSQETDIASWIAKMSPDDRSREKLDAIVRLCFEEGFYRGAMAAKDGRSINDSLEDAAALASTSGAGEGEATKIDGRLYANVSTQPFQCPHCDCRSYARVSERKGDGSFRPGLLIRCVECKTVYRDANAVEFPIPAPAEHGVEKCDWRDRSLTNAERLIVFASYHSDKLGQALRDELLEFAAEWQDEVEASQGGGAGRSERAVEIRELSDLYEECRGWFEAFDVPSHAEGGFQVRTATCDAEAFRLSIRATFRDVAAALRDLVCRSEIAGRSEKGAGDGLERVRHVKRGTEYEVLGEAEAQVSEGMKRYGKAGAMRLIADDDKLTVYRCLKTGKLWCRFTDEFRDGRFVAPAPAQSPSTSEREG